MSFKTNQLMYLQFNNNQKQTQFYHSPKWCNLLKRKIFELQKGEIRHHKQNKRNKTPIQEYTNVVKTNKQLQFKLYKNIKGNTLLPSVELPSHQVLIQRNNNDTFEDTSKNFITRPLNKTQRNIWHSLSKTPVKRQSQLINSNFSASNMKSVSKINFQNLKFSLYKNNKPLLRDFEQISKGVMTQRKLNDQERYMNYIVRRIDNHAINCENNKNSNNNSPRNKL